MLYMKEVPLVINPPRIITFPELYDVFQDSQLIFHSFTAFNVLAYSLHFSSGTTTETQKRFCLNCYKQSFVYYMSCNEQHVPQSSQDCPSSIKAKKEKDKSLENIYISNKFWHFLVASKPQNQFKTLSDAVIVMSCKHLNI